jgi:DNA-binding response OmpR family regulator
MKPIPQYRSKNALIVEKSWHVANAMKAYLESLGMAVGMAGSLEDAERLTTEQTFDLALVDINLRDETTYELMERLKRQGVRVIALSGYPVPQASAASAAAILQKPYSGRELLAVLTKVCSGGG